MRSNLIAASGLRALRGAGAGPVRTPAVDVFAREAFRVDRPGRLDWRTFSR